MIRDLRTLLDGWDYEPGKISVRKIIGRDQKEKIQARVDMGVMQFEVGGRPDGQHPGNCESLLEYHELRLAKHLQDEGNDEGFTLTQDHCRDLRHEAYLYHQRYVALFVLEEYDGVERDTEHTLRIIEMCRRHAAEPPDSEALEGYRNYVFMMNTRARAFLAAQRGSHETALSIIDSGLGVLRSDENGLSDEAQPNGEVELLLDLRREIINCMPQDAVPRLNVELQEALQAENYEAAAKIRDRMAAAQTKKAS